MKTWTKFERELLCDERVKRLLDEYGMKGLGLYTLMRLAADCEDGLTQEEMLRLGCQYGRRRQVSAVLYFYGLFTTDNNGFVCTAPRRPVRASVPASMPAPVPPCTPAAFPACSPAAFPAPVPCIGTEKENKNKKEEVLKEEDDDCRAWLVDEANMPWRESVMMQSGMSSLLVRHWQEAVDYFLQHAKAQDELGRLDSQHEVRRYFSNYCKVSKPTGRALQEYLQGLEAQAAGADAEVDNALWR